MSVLGAWLGKFAGAMGGVPAAGAIVAGGLVVGIVVGGLSGGGGLGGSPAPSIVVSEIYPCPNMGPPLKSIQSGQHVYVTGKLADGSWLRIHYGSAGLTEAWIPAGAYSVLGSLDDVPEATCTQAAIAAFAPAPAESDTDLGSFEPTPVPTAPPTAAPTATPTPTPTPAAPTATPRGTPRPTPRVTPKPTTKPTPPPTPAPTPTPDTTPPRISNPVANPHDLVPPPCGQGTSTVTTSITEAGGLSSVVLRFTDPSGFQRQKNMSSAGGGTWAVGLSMGNDQLPLGPYTMRVTAVDKAGNQATSGNGSFEVFTCIT